MKTHVEFKSDRFPAYEGEEEVINPGRWGKRLAEFISKGLKKAGVPVEEVHTEDWGWVIPVRNEHFSLWIGCCNYDEYEDGFLCFIEPSKPFVRRLFKKIPTVEKVTELARSVDKVLSSEPGIRDIFWWTPEEFNNPITKPDALKEGS